MSVGQPPHTTSAAAAAALLSHAKLGAIANCLGPAEAAVIGAASPASGSTMIGFGLLAYSTQGARLRGEQQSRLDDPTRSAKTTAEAQRSNPDATPA